MKDKEVHSFHSGMFVLPLTLVLLSGCLSSESRVEFNQVLLPHMTEIGKIAVVLDGTFEPKIADEIVESLKKCPLYTDVRVLDKSFNIGSAASEEAFALHLSKYAKTSGGLLRIRMEHSENTEETDKSQSFLLFDQPTYDWFPAFGVPLNGTMGFATGMEIAPEVKKRRRTPLIRTSRTQQVYRMSLYNKSTGKIVFDRIGKNTSSLSVFSKDPAFKKAQFDTLVRGSLLQDVAFYSCPPSAAVVRHLYPSTANSNAARTIGEGIASADAGDWDAAATKWNAVLANDPKNTLAHHNIGVFYERNGDVMEALKHYRLGVRDRRITEDAFGEIIGNYLPQDSAMEAMVAQVTGGNWIFVDVPEGEKRTRGSVYRATPIIDPDSSRVIGQTLKEIATVRVVSTQETRRAARIREYLLDSPIRAGDIVVFADVSPSKAP
ncbi:MAG: tetratricopeptide repeat protein [Chitinophagaceae bacterium]|nr:tetratricopeptide repeat protein [Oligoflexus sp.]